MALASGCGKIRGVKMVVDIKIIFLAFWLTPSAVAAIMVIFRGYEQHKFRVRNKRDYVFVKLRTAGYNICDVNSNATCAKLIVMDPLTEQTIHLWCDVVDLGGGYALGDPINSERN